MAKQVDLKTAQNRPLFIRYKYDWDNWLNGQAWELIRGEDFDCEFATFRSALYEAARKRQMRGRCRQLSSGNVVIWGEPA